MTDKEAMKFDVSAPLVITPHPAFQKLSKEEALAIIRLLSALESWAFSTKNKFPDFLHDEICRIVKKLEKIVLEKNT